MQARDIIDPKAWAGAIAVVVGFIILSLPGVSWGADGTYTFEDFAIPNPTRGETSRVLLVINASQHVGQTCTIRVDTANGESVHPENYVTVEGVIPTIFVSGTEDGAFGEHQNTETVRIGTAGEIRVVNHFSLATSVRGTVTISCTVDQATTTTAPPETTTTTGPPPATSTTTIPDTSTTTTPVTSTQPPETTTTTVPPVTTSPPDTPDETLPFTGPEDHPAVLGAAAAILAALGGLGLYATRSRGGRHEA